MAFVPFMRQAELAVEAGDGLVQGLETQAPADPERYPHLGGLAGQVTEFAKILIGHHGQRLGRNAGVR